MIVLEKTAITPQEETAITIFLLPFTFLPQGYRPSAVRASILFFVLNALSRIDPMYQYSLTSYIRLFESSVSNSPKSELLTERIESLNEYHTYAVFK